ncbi:MAG: hypothetical protein FWE24_07615 [Defluviitaleaceae bacterium]|nr:hypothetical protein [Defluviitaleaceae bacterium]
MNTAKEMKSAELMELEMVSTALKARNEKGNGEPYQRYRRFPHAEYLKGKPHEIFYHVQCILSRYFAAIKKKQN